METNNMIGKVVGITVALICVAVILMPVLSDATTTEDTFENEGYFKMTKYTTEEITMTFDASTPTVVDVNGVDVTLPDVNVAVSIVASDIFCLRYNTDATFQCFSGNSNTGVAADENWSLVANNGTMTFTNTTTSTSRTAEYETLYIISNEGDWAMKNSTVPAYMNEDSFFMGVGLTAGSSAIGIVGLNVSGSIEDGATIVAWRGNGLTFTNVTLVEETVDTHIDLYSLDKVTFTATDTDNDSLDITYSYFIVPSEVTAERAQHLNAGEISIVGAIPVMMIVAIVLMSVGIVTSRRD